MKIGTKKVIYYSLMRRGASHSLCLTLLSTLFCITRQGTYRVFLRYCTLRYETKNMTSHDIISYHIISYHIISYHIISYHIISYHIISYHIISYPIISHHITSYLITSHHIISHHITSHHITSLEYISFRHHRLLVKLFLSVMRSVAIYLILFFIFSTATYRLSTSTRCRYPLHSTLIT